MEDNYTLVERPPAAKESTLSVFGRPEWFTSADASSIWIRIYVVVGISRDNLEARAAALPQTLALDRPVALAIGYLGGLKLTHFDYTFHSADSGQLVLKLDPRERELPGGTYLTLATPHTVDGHSGSEYESKRRLDRASALLTLHFGYNHLRDVAYTGEVQMATSQFSMAGPAMRSPFYTDGPFLYPDAKQEISEICAKLAGIPAEIGQRVGLALDYYEQASRELDGFFSLWTALEILCNGKAQTIRSTIQACYSLRSVKDVDDGLGFRHVARWRHDYVHKGIRPVVSVFVERYLQLLFLDLLRRILGLSHRGFALGFSQSPGIDLSAIGLADHRTPEQREASARAQNGPLVSPVAPG